GAGAEEEVGGVPDGGIAGDAREGVAAAALEADDQVGGGAGRAAAAVEPSEALLGGSHDGGDGFGEAALVLQSDDVALAEDGQLIAEEAGGLELLAAEADDQRVG